MKPIKKLIIKYLTPSWALHTYHYLLALAGACWYRFPSRQMVVIGITGTKGKTSTANFIHATLNTSGHKTGIISTANIKIGNEESLNKYHMTMPGRFTIHKLMRQMADTSCTHCVVETTSEGLKQYRHIGIAYDYAIFTNLTPEHLASHGGNFEKYKETKGKLFAAVTNRKTKTLGGKTIPRTIIANADSDHASYFLSFGVDKKITYSTQNKGNVNATEIETTTHDISFKVGEDRYTSPILGAFNVENILPAIIVATEEGGSPTQIKFGLKNLKSIPGRMEIINVGQDFTVIVDYAHEKESMTRVLDTGRSIVGPNHKVIVLLGAEGGGRDKTKRPIMGALAGQKADFVIVSNVDPYDDDPEEILNDIAKASTENGKALGQNLFVVADRQAGISKALSLASSGDIVLITGKGAEQSMIIGTKTIPWDDRTIVKDELEKQNR